MISLKEMSRMDRTLYTANCLTAIHMEETGVVVGGFFDTDEEAKSAIGVFAQANGYQYTGADKWGPAHPFTKAALAGELEGLTWLTQTRLG